jgi:hypothetical protein
VSTVTLILVVLSLAAAAASVAVAVRARRAGGGDAAPAVLVSGALLAGVMAVVDRGAVLSWRLGVGTGDERTLLPGVGILLGAALLAATGGSLLLVIRMALPSVEGAGRAATTALWVAVVAGGLGVGLAVVRLLPLSEPLREAGIPSLALIVATAAGVVLMLLAASGPTPSDASREAAWAERAARVALVFAVVAALACGVEGWWRAGTYATSATAAASSAVLVALAAAEARGSLALVLRGLLVVALAGALAV